MQDVLPHPLEPARMPSIVDESYKKYDSELRQVSLEIHKYSELAFEEHKSAKLITEVLEKHGFVVERGIAGVATAFVATFGEGKPLVSFNAVGSCRTSADCRNMMPSPRLVMDVGII